MKAEMSNKQLARLTPEAVDAIDKYRRNKKRQTGKRPSINSALNILIVIGWEYTRNQEYTLQGEAQR